MEAHSSLTKCELEVMDVVWRLGRGTVQEVCDTLERQRAYTTVMTILKILEEKRRVLRRMKSGRAYVYEPIVSREEICKSVAGELKQHLFRGSVKSMVLSLIDDNSVSRADIDELRAAIDSLDARE